MLHETIKQSFLSCKHFNTGTKHMAKVLNEEPGRCQIALCNVDWPRYLSTNEVLEKSPRLSIIASEEKASENFSESSQSLVQRITLEQDSEKRKDLIHEYISLAIPDWFGIAVTSEADLNKSLYSYGVDSTSALTLKMQLQTDLQVSFEVCLFINLSCARAKLIWSNILISIIILQNEDSPMQH